MIVDGRISDDNCFNKGKVLSDYNCASLLRPEQISLFEPLRDKTNKVSVRPAKTQISLGIRQVWSESSLSAWRKLGSLDTHWAHSEDSDQTGRMPRLICVCVLIRV